MMEASNEDPIQYNPLEEPCILKQGQQERIKLVIETICEKGQPAKLPDLSRSVIGDMNKSWFRHTYSVVSETDEQVDQLMESSQFNTLFIQGPMGVGKTWALYFKMLKEYINDRFLIYVSFKSEPFSDTQEEQNAVLFYREVFYSMIFFNDKEGTQKAGEKTLLQKYLGDSLALKVKKELPTKAEALQSLYREVCRQLGERDTTSLKPPLLIIDEAQTLLRGPSSSFAFQLSTDGYMQNYGRGKAVFCVSAEFPRSKINFRTYNALFHDVQPNGMSNDEGEVEKVAAAIEEYIKLDQNFGRLKQGSQFKLFAGSPKKEKLKEEWKERQEAQAGAKPDPGPDACLLDLSDKNIKEVSKYVVTKCKGTFKFIFAAIARLCINIKRVLEVAESTDLQYLVMCEYRNEVEMYLQTEIDRYKKETLKTLSGIGEDECRTLFHAIYRGMYTNQHFMPAAFMGLMYRTKVSTTEWIHRFVNSICESVAEDFLITMCLQALKSDAPGILLEMQVFQKIYKKGLELDGKHRYYNEEEATSLTIPSSSMSFRVTVQGKGGSGEINFQSPQELRTWIRGHLYEEQIGTCMLRGLNTPGWDMYIIEKVPKNMCFRIVLIQVSSTGTDKSNDGHAIDQHHYQKMGVYTESTLKELGKLVVPNVVCERDENEYFTLTDPDSKVLFDVHLIFISVPKIKMRKSTAHSGEPIQLKQLLVISGSDLFQLDNL